MIQRRWGGTPMHYAVVVRHAAVATLATALAAAIAPAMSQTQTPAPTSAGATGSTRTAPPSKPAANSGATPRSNPANAGTPAAHGHAKPQAQAAQQRRGQVPPPTTAAQRAALPVADDAQKAAADLVYYGKYVCDQKWEIHVERNSESPGYVDVRYQKDVWVMKPVASATGAVRLEDMRLQTLLVQIPSKSMLLNTRTGQRLVDSCVGEGHVQALAAIKAAEVSAAAETLSASSAPAASVAPPASGGAFSSSVSPAPSAGPIDPVIPARKPD